MSTTDILRSYRHYHLAVTIAKVLSNVTQNRSIIGSKRRRRRRRRRKEASQKKCIYMV
jgi:hypothetical protein